jgi:hypothetical protein
MTWLLGDWYVQGVLPVPVKPSGREAAARAFPEDGVGGVSEDSAENSIVTGLGTGRRDEDTDCCMSWCMQSFGLNIQAVLSRLHSSQKWVSDCLGTRAARLFSREKLGRDRRVDNH